MLTKNIFKTNGRRALFSNLDEKVVQRPNKKIFGLLPLGLILYNQSDPKLDEVFTVYFSIAEAYRSGKEKETLDSLLLKYELSEYIGKNIWWDKFFFKNGEKPIIIDSSATTISAKNIDQYYHSKGFFNAVTSIDLSLKNKKGKIIYNIDTGDPYSIRSISYHFKDPELEKIFQKNLQLSQIKKRKIFNEEAFKAELERIENLYENNGYYKFNLSNEDIIFEIDSTVGNHQINVRMNVNKKKIINDEVKKNYSNKKYHFNTVEITFKTDHTIPTNVITHQGYQLILPSTLKYKPKAITDAIVIHPGDLYRNKDIITTKRNLYALQNFNISGFKVEEIPSDPSNPKALLNANILLSPLKKYELQLSFEASVSDFSNLGISPGISLMTRNLFGGAENLELSLKGNLVSIKKTSNKINGFFNAWETAAQAKLNFPHFLLPFNTERLIPKYYNPRSTIKSRFNMQKNIGIGRLNFSVILDYKWNTTPLEKQKFELINLHFIENLEKNRYFDFYDNDRATRDAFCKAYDEWQPGREKHCLENNNSTYVEALKMATINQSNIDRNILKQYLKMQSRRTRIINDYLIHSISYSHEYNQTLDKIKKNPILFRGKLETTGNLLSWLSKPLSFRRKKIGKKEIFKLFDVPYSQFIKINLDLRKYWHFSSNQTFATRISIGAAFPYGNSDQLPFDRSYFGGGSNDIRAWQAYDLGPGNVSNYSRDLSFSDLKLILNAEYRFKMIFNLFGSLFLDAGNIWSLKGEDTADPGRFQWNTFYKQLALGGGIGFRYDFKFLIARIDLAYKLHDPAKPIRERWRLNKLGFDQTIVNFGIGYPF
ncbi:MAG: BamA/TamA family outer membrane protein [Flavobacteriales bacterium AspAUS03]